MRRSRILVCIANHGTKNQRFLERLLSSYRAMAYAVDIVVLSDAPKELGEDVEVLVGAPSENPWSLPFAHRAVFAERADDYDLFIYSEDDTLIEEEHLRTFLEVDGLLSDDEIAGFLRYERFPSGERSYCSIHSAYRWEPRSVEVRQGQVFAAYSNQHSACYVLTRDQLRRAIRSGGFLVEPYEGEYDMLVTAATDPYTRCGMTRRLCVSRIDEFVLHHLPNVYLGKLGIEEAEFRAQLGAITAIAHGELEPSELFDPASRLPTIQWDVPYHPIASPELAELCRGSEHALSVAATAGRLEREVFADARAITAVPLDPIIAAVARTHGLETTDSDLTEALRSLDGRRFDTILLHQALHHVEDPVTLLQQLRPLLAEGGRLIVSAPNVRYHRLRARSGRSDVPLPDGGFAQDGVHATDPAVVRSWARAAGFTVQRRRFELTDAVRRVARFVPGSTTWLGATMHLELEPRGRG